LGGAIFFFNHEMADGRLNEFVQNQKALEGLQAEIEKVVQGAAIRFGLILPQKYPDIKPLPPAPGDMRYYWDWYYSMKALVLEQG